MNHRKVIISLIALLTAAALVIGLIVSGFFLGGGKTPAAHNTSASQSAQDSPSAQPSNEENGAAEQKLSPEVIQVIDNQHRLIADDPRALGNLDAPVIIEMYSDYRCGHCRDWTLHTLPELQSLLDEGKIRIEYNSMPVLGDDSVLIAQASHAAASQHKFWEFHKELFANPPQPTKEALTALAGSLGMDEDAFAAEMVAEQTVKDVTGEREHGVALGITGTPSFLIGYSFVPGALPADKFIDVINKELVRPDPHTEN
ncbi:DsbA family protein [Arcanobacterium buesumense]|uniref:Thioredoxin domain-containing protein n=1 Tax=Arcanobacterium buesumense TaxID=2722751 RepID=A0A6H2END1_9ACTO|nr:thioredoxin domain-containing protein [Arcanobacterium buesumense]QJC22588.1 thioredoxin domain-containing protein [Arcanobacterium buesumense]